ncbi:glycosyltransferase family 2 protein [Patescibacteria group bacterium]|nr:glycosyltransferase family 2 protein [Patescibacteria group bacterium]
MIDTAVIILNWNGREHLDLCLRSVYQQTYSKYQVVFVDNGSSDKSVDFVEAKFSSATIIRNRKNYGFAEGNNIGIRQALHNQDIKYIVTLNNDTEVHPDWLKYLMETAANDEKIGAVSSKMLFFDQRNVIDSAGDFLMSGSLKTVTRGYREEDIGQYNKTEECFSARAGAALYRRQMLEEIVLDDEYFDSHFFAYVEDTDLSIRARLAGWKIVYEPKAIVYHKVAATTKLISHDFRRYQSGRNRIFTAIKNFPVRLWPLAIRNTKSVDEDYQMSVIEELKLFLRIAGSVLISLPRLLSQRKKIRSASTVSSGELYSWIKKFSI